MVALRIWAELRKESERKGGRTAREGEEEKPGVDIRGDMLRYGSRPTVSTTTTTTEDSPEALREVRSSREARTLKISLSFPHFSLLSSSLCVLSCPVFFPPLFCLSAVAFNSADTCFPVCKQRDPFSLSLTFSDSVVGCVALFTYTSV